MIRSSRLIPLVVLVGSLLAWSACSKKETLQFPAGFLFGTAIAGFQVEMGCPTIAAATCEDRHSDWYTFISDPTLVADTSLHLNGDPPGSGPGFYELYEGDLERAQNELKSNTLRLSIEWSRVFPTSTVGVTGYDNLKALADPTALAYYHALFTALKAHNLKPFVTLNHYTLPTWIHNAAGCHRDLAHCSPRGWLDANTPVEIAKYAGFVAQEFGADVDLWATLNEPFTAVVLAGYLQPGDARTNPPAVTLQWDAAKLAIQNMIKAHNLMAIAVKAADTVDADGDGKAARVGLVYNVQATSPRTNSFVDKQGARNLSYLMNEMFLDGAINGDLDLKLDGTKEHHDELSGNTDFLGINYYDRVTCDGLSNSAFPTEAPLFTFNPLTLTVTGDASGIDDALTLGKSYNLPIFITETGTLDDADTGAAAKWVAETFTRARRQMDEGVRLEGIYYWTLMDNYEWNHGMSQRYGMYAVDKNDSTKARVPRPKLIDAFKRIATTGLIPDDLVVPPAQ